jgi:hypothetical protein
MGWGNGMAIGWPNASYQQGTPNLTAYIPNPNNGLFDITTKDYTIAWWAGDIHPSPIGEYNIFFSFGTTTGVHSAFLVNTGSFGVPSYRFIYIIDNITIIDAGMPVDPLYSHFYCIERKDGRVYFSVDGTWELSFGTGNPDVLSQGNPLYIGSKGTNSPLLGWMNNFIIQPAPLFDVTSPFTPPSDNLTSNGATKLLVMQEFGLSNLIIDNSSHANDIIPGSLCSAVSTSQGLYTGSLLFKP